MEAEQNYEYPKAKYRAGCDPIVVYTPEEEAELPDGWFSNPNDVMAVETPVKRKRGNPNWTKATE